MTATMNPYLARTDAFMAPLARVPGVEVYRVGGSVRDEILDRYVKDADYMVRGISLDDLGAHLNTMARHAHAKGAAMPLKLRDGRQAGWRVSAKGIEAIEIALPRKEVSTGPGHRDFEIVLDPNLTLEEDAERRDFTFNALYKGVEPQGWSTSMVLPDGRPLTNVVDPTGRGLYDLHHMLVNTTHPDSFRDDPLRTLRALRFVSTLGYDLASHTKKQMHQQAQYVNGLTANGHASGTVYDEMSKLLMGADVAKALRLARDTGVLGALFPELVAMLGFEQGSRYHDLTTDEHTFEALRRAAKADAPLEVRWALLFHDSGKPETAWTGKDGRMHYYSNGETEDHEVAGARRWIAAAERMSSIPKGVRTAVETIILEHMLTVQPKNVGVKVRRARVRLGDQMLSWVIMHRMCDLAGKGRATKASLTNMLHVGEQETIRQEAQDAGVPIKPADLAINGKDVMELGARGRQVGAVLAAVLDEVVCDPTEQKLSREWQLTAAARAAR